MGAGAAARPRVNERELRILRSHLEASLLDEELATRPWRGRCTNTGAARARALLARRQPTLDPPPIAEGPGKRATLVADGPAGRSQPRRELRGRAGWAWSRLFRRYDEYELALGHLHAAAERDDRCRRPPRRTVNV